jgi:hypothetical protein
MGYTEQPAPARLFRSLMPSRLGGTATTLRVPHISPVFAGYGRMAVSGGSLVPMRILGPGMRLVDISADGSKTGVAQIYSLHWKH